MGHLRIAFWGGEGTVSLELGVTWGRDQVFFMGGEGLIFWSGGDLLKWEQWMMVFTQHG